MKKALVYSRVSTSEQAETGYSLSTQNDACRRYAASNGFMVVAELADDCSGTISIQDRPQGRKIYEMVDTGAVDAVILFTHDRTARDDKVIEYLLFKAHLYDKGVELHYSDTGLDPYTMEGNLIGYIKANAATAERKKIAERSTRGRLAKAASGKWVGTGVPPYGYRKVGLKRDARMEVNEDEANIIKRIFLDYNAGKHSQKIAAELTMQGVPPPSRTRIAACWYKANIIKMLKNRRFLGEISYRGIIHHFPELAIIDEETWQAAQEQMEKRKVFAKRNRKGYYLLAGVLHCSCGRKMQGLSLRSRHNPYYMCNSYGNHRHTANCQPKHLRADKVDAVVWVWLQELITNEENLDEGLREMAERGKVGKAEKQIRLTEVSNLIDKVEHRIRRLISNLGQIDDDTVAEEMGAQIKLLTQQKDGWIKEQRSLEVEMAQEELSPSVQAWIKAKAAEIREKMVDPSFDGKRTLIEKLDIYAKLRNDETGLWVDVSCGIQLELESLPLDVTDNQFEKPDYSRLRSGAMRRRLLSCTTTVRHEAQYCNSQRK